MSNAAIHPICQQNSLIGSFFTPSSDFWLQTDTYTYNGNDVNINMTYGIKDLYHDLGVSSPFQKPELFLEYAEGNSNNWIEHEEISLANINQSQTCLTYNTIISAIDLQGYQTIKYRLVYKSPAQTGTLYLLYWSLDQLEIGEGCVSPQAPQGQAHQTLPQDSTLADVVVTGANLKWYADEDLTQPLKSNDALADMAYYWVTQTINGCESEALMVMVHLQALSVNDFDFANLKAYPNPVKDILNISSEQEISGIEIFNLLGQRIVDKKINTNTTSIDLSVFPQGNYILKIKSGNNQKTLKVVKQ